jgi:hypothetical protein
MLKRWLFFLSFSSCPFLAAAPLQFDEFSFEQTLPQNLIVNNRILLKLNGKVITVMDVVRKMDLLFYRQYPELADSNIARYQFYSSGWRTVLGAVIDDHLIMEDADEKKVTVNDGEVREELEKMFGPDVVITIDKLGMSLDEAFDLLKTELTVQRMTSIMVHSRAMTDVHPMTVKQRYEKVRSDNPPLNYWVYRILSIRGTDHEKAAEKAYRLMQTQGIPFEELAKEIREEGIEVAYSDELRQKEADMSLSYKAILQTLAAGGASAPVSNQKVSRLFCFKGMEKVDPPTFRAAEEGIKQELTQEATTRYNQEYRQKLRKLHGLTQNYLSQTIPDNLHPFVLR